SSYLHDIPLPHSSPTLRSSDLLTILLVPPTITGEPPDIQTNSGANITLKVTATGTAPLSYQWYYNGSALAAATKSSLSVANASRSEEHTSELQSLRHLVCRLLL